ncbi:ComF family protein [Pseudomonas entomophila]|uniref:ComF family protein n=1 Tax=Pseudomonas entomophila TaxID=312306 RepID=UPI0024074B8D|nr:ComF family protein [Pseudomonas entomophila]MDF9618134.1 ComF family protein [Pseudomonas entomophila]
MVIHPLPATPAWDYGISLDKHIVSSVPIGPNEYGHMQFDTIRTALGEAVFQLKYRDNYKQVEFLAQSVAGALAGHRFDVVLPMPASKQRPRQPVYEVAQRAAALLEAGYSEQTLEKRWSTGLMKDLAGYEERVKALAGCFTVNANLQPGSDILVLDDLFDTGASLEAACTALREYASIRSISVVALTRRH